MPSRRGLLDIMASILRAAKDEGPITKTRAVYAANLNFSRAERYLNMMVELGLMEEVDRGGGRRAFKATEKGKAFLEDLGRLKARPSPSRTSA